MALEIRLGGSGLGRVRITNDAVWETVASLHTVASGRSHPAHARLRESLR